MQKIVSHLWFDKDAKEAAELYVANFGKGSKVKNIAQLDNTPSGSVDIVTFELLGREFQAISAGFLQPSGCLPRQDHIRVCNAPVRPGIPVTGWTGAG